MLKIMAGQGNDPVIKSLAEGAKDLLEKLQ